MDSRLSLTSLPKDVLVFLNGPAAYGLKKGEPALFDAQTLRLLEIPTFFIRRHYVESGRRASPHTWRDAAFAMASWIEFLAEIGIPDLHIAGRPELLAYREMYEAGVSPFTKRPYATGTIANRMSVITAFYERSIEWGWHSDASMPHVSTWSPSRSPLDRSALSHLGRVDRPRSWTDLAPKRRPNKSAIRPFMAAEIPTFLQALGPRATEQVSDPRPCRDRLIGDFGLFVGLRNDEIHQIARCQIESMRPDNAAPAAEQPLAIVGKGRKKRIVAVPNWLVLDALTYITTERAAALLARRDDVAEPPDLFLSGVEANAPGRPISHRRFQQVIEEACLRTNLIVKENVTDPGTGQLFVRDRAIHCVHDLRHTYAVLTYWFEKRNGNPEPWKKIQAQLGHAQLTTTINTYLSFVEIFGQHGHLFDARRLLGIAP